MKYPLLLALTLLSACASVGTQYKFSSANEDVAELQKPGHGAFINNFDKEGCYAGRTDVADGAELRAGEEVVLSMEAHYRERGWTFDQFCRELVGLTPQSGAKYALGLGFFRVERTKPGIFGNTEGPLECGVRVFQLAADGSKTLVPTRSLQLRQRRLACIRAEPAKQG